MTDPTSCGAAPTGEPGGACADARAQLDALRSEHEDLTARYQRMLADFQNYQRRSLQSERDARAAGVVSGVQGFLSVLEHLDVALSAPGGGAPASAEQLLAGLRAIRDEMVKALRVQGIEPIAPAANEAFSPGRHEAIAQAPGEGVEPGRIVSTMQVGYAMGERLIRPARVVVAPG